MKEKTRKTAFYIEVTNSSYKNNIQQFT